MGKTVHAAASAAVKEQLPKYVQHNFLFNPLDREELRVMLKEGQLARVKTEITENWKETYDALADDVHTILENEK
jgi:hypothetical protein